MLAQSVAGKEVRRPPWVGFTDGSEGRISAAPRTKSGGDILPQHSLDGLGRFTSHPFLPLRGSGLLAFDPAVTLILCVG